MPKKSILALLFLLATILLCPGPARSQSDADAPKLLFQARQIDPLVESPGSNLLESVESDADIDTEQEDTSGSGLLRLFSFSLPGSLIEDDDYYIVQFSGPVQSAWKDALTELGAQFYDYVPQHAFIVRLSESKFSEVEALGYVRWIGEYVPELKLSQGVYDITPEELEAEGNLIDLRILAFPDADADAIADAIAETGGTVVSSRTSGWHLRFDVTIPIVDVTALKDIKGLKWIERAPDHHTSNNITLGIVRTRTEQEKTWPVSGGPLYGEGQTVAICDSGIDSGDPATLSEDFSDGLGTSRVTVSVLSGASRTDVSGHGTHVAGIVGGNGMLSGASPTTNDFPETCLAGAAPKAQLYVQAVGADDGTSRLPGIPGDLADLFQPAYDAGARIHTNSWGTSGAGSYDSEAVTVDQFMWDHKDFAIVYAVGNAGYDKDMDGVTDPYSIDSPATAKNCLSVGASESYRTESGEGFADRAWGSFRTYADPIASDLTSDEPYGLAAFSGRGPTLDGRYKPEIIAPGTNILSTRSSYQLGNGWGAYNDDYYWSGGTSMATPLVAGTAAVMREYLMKEEGFASPSAALLKTSLIHGATSLVPGQYGTGAAQEVLDTPDITQGWGRLNLTGSINADDRLTVEYHDISDSPPADDSYSRTFTFDVDNAEQPFRATLGWTDYPGSVAAVGGLVNDLDLRVRQPDGAWVYPDNAVNASPLDSQLYVSTVNGFSPDDAIGLRFTPPSTPCTLESVALAYYNGQSVLGDISIVVYAFDGGVGEELFRKELAYIPSGEYAIPVGLTVNQGEVVVALQKSSASHGVYYANGNATGRGLINNGGSWEVAGITPALIANFRTTTASTDFDRLNNTVSVTIDEPQSGTYTAEVSAHSIPVGPQPYALILSGMTGATAVDQQIGLNPDQPDAPAASVVARAGLGQTAVSVNATYGTDFRTVYGQQQSFTVSAPAGSVISMRYPVSGLPSAAAQELTLTKLLTSGTHRDFRYAPLEDYSDGNWWLTDAAGSHIAPTRTLSPAATYYVVSAILDGGPYDADPAAGSIEDPQILGGGASTVGAGGGCTVGGGRDNGLLFVLLLAGMSVILRRRTARRG